MDAPFTSVKIACSQVVAEALMADEAAAVAEDTVVALLTAVVVANAAADKPVAEADASSTSAISLTVRRGKISRTTSDSVEPLTA
jgi:hypothetical protein